MPKDHQDMRVRDTLYDPKDETANETFPGVTPAKTGDGKNAAVSLCVGTVPSTKWYLFEKSPVPNYAKEYCSIPMDKLLPHFCNLTRYEALDNAQILKNNGIKIYVIGLGSSTEIDTNYLQSLSSGTSYTYITPNTSELEAIFSRVAKEIKLRLVQ